MNGPFEIRVAPGAWDVAIRNRVGHTHQWRTAAGSYCTDEQVADWVVVDVPTASDEPLPAGDWSYC